MRIIVGTQQTIAERAADLYGDILSAKPNAVLGFATGSTPLPLYAELVKRHRAGQLSFRDVTSFNLDEYLGLPATHPQSYRYFMQENLFGMIDLPQERIHVPSGVNTSSEQLAAYDAAIGAAGGIDMQLLGLGGNGHIGFNEPGTPFGSDTHIVELTEDTRQANKRFFSSIDEVPTHAATMGVRSVMRAKSIVLIATGKGKAAAVKSMIQGEVTPAVPASVLQLHPFVTIFLDEEAASLL